MNCIWLGVWIPLSACCTPAPGLRKPTSLGPGMIMTAALLAAAPPVVVYAFLMDYYIAGLTAGATKG